MIKCRLVIGYQYRAMFPSCTMLKPQQYRGLTLRENGPHEEYWLHDQHDLSSQGDGKSYEKVTDRVPFEKKMTDGTAHGDALRLTQP